MAENTGITGAVVQDDNPTVPDEQTPTPEQVKTALLGETKPETEEHVEPETKEEVPEDKDAAAKPEGEEKPEQQAQPEPEKPDQTEQVDLTEEKRFTQKDIDRLFSEWTKKERSREDSAMKKLRDLELVSGSKVDQLVEQVRQGKVQAIVDRLGVDEMEARAMVVKDEERQRLLAERDQMAKEREEEKRVNTYIQERNTFFSDPSIPTDVKALAKKYAVEIDMVADGGRATVFAAARDYVLGTKLPEIIAERAKAIEQKTIANIQKNSAAKPITASAGGTSSEPVLSVAQKNVAHMLFPDLSQAEAERRYAKRAKETRR